MVTIMLGFLGFIGLCYLFTFGKDVIKHRSQLENNSLAKTGVFGFIANFCDALGIGSFAILVALLKFFKQTSDKKIPGTLNVGCTIAALLEAFIFINIIKVNALVLTAMIAAAGLGAWFGAGIVAKLSEKTVRLVMGIALLVTVFFMFAGKMHWMPAGGTAITLPYGKLAFATAANFMLGAIMTAGIGLFAPCLALVYFMGMSPRVAFPIMMGSCAIIMPAASFKFIKAKAYDRKASIGIAIGGTFGVIIAAYLVKSLPINTLEWLVMAVILYTAIVMLYGAFSKKEICGANSKVANST